MWPFSFWVRSSKNDLETGVKKQQDQHNSKHCGARKELCNAQVVEWRCLHSVIISIKLVTSKAIILLIFRLYLGYSFIFNFLLYLGIMCMNYKKLPMIATVRGEKYSVILYYGYYY